MAMGPPDEAESSLAAASPEPPVRPDGWATRTYPAPLASPLPDSDEPAAIAGEPLPFPATPRGVSMTSWLVLGVAAAIMAAMTFVIPAWTVAHSTPRVVLLGCGSSLSVLIQAGDARVVIAAGDDPAAYGTAIDRALALSPGRIDLLIVGGTGKDLAVPADLASDDHVRQVVRLGSPHPGRETGDLPAGLPQVPPRARIEVAPGVVALIETVEIPDPDGGGDFDLAWRAEIRHGAATVTILSDAKHAGEFAPLTSRGALVAASDPGPNDLGSLLPAPAGALVVSADHIDGSEIRADLPPLIITELPTIRVHSGTAVTLLLDESGVELPPDDVVIVQPASPSEGS